MPESHLLSPSELETLLRRAQMVKAPATLRAKGSNRMLGDLQLRGLEIGAALHLSGAKRRDQVPEPGTEILLSLLLGEEVLAIHTHLLEPLIPDSEEGGFAPVLRTAWPVEGVSFHHRADVRVAAPDQAPLDAELRKGAEHRQVRILNMTESGLGLGLADLHFLSLGEAVEVDCRLPGGAAIHLAGEVRHLETLPGDLLACRAGLVLTDNPPSTVEALRAFVQQRRMDRSESLRKGGA